MINRKSLEIRHRKGLLQCKVYWGYEKKWLTPRAIGRAGTTPVPCSCPMCGNPRRKCRGKAKLTIQELRILQED